MPLAYPHPHLNPLALALAVPLGLLLALAVVPAGSVGAADDVRPLRPPAVPLVTHDPYFSVWSMADRLTDDWPKHWTGATNGACGLARVDGKAYRWMGPPAATKPEVPAMTQASLSLTPTRTTYEFDAGGVRLTVGFLSPMIAGDLELVGRPLSYVTWSARSTDGKSHDVAVYLDVSAEWAVNKPEQEVVASREAAAGKDGGADLVVMRVGTREQPVLAKKGDNLRIDWGHLVLAAPAAGRQRTAIAADEVSRPAFVSTGAVPEGDDKEFPRPANRRWPVLAYGVDLGSVGEQAAGGYLMLAYDDEFSIEYFGKPLRPWWRRDGTELAGLLAAAAKDFPALDARCRKFDEELTADLRKVGGEAYARMAVLSYRQCLAAHKLVDDGHGRPLWFSKENFSNGCIDTVDVTYPSAPFFLLLNPALLKGQLTPIMDYAAGPRWKFNFAPHDLGTYPKANGQVYGDGERGLKNQMPVEECGNMLILLAALAEVEGNADYAVKYWPTLEKWAGYLKENGLDPTNQLCTDDFAGHLARNANLSLKAIVALGGYARLCERAGKGPAAAEWRRVAEGMAKQWQQMADDGDHYRLTFDKAGTWSQKYNLVWDKVLGLKLFPPAVREKEVAFYKAHQNEYGLPLDSRKAYTKLDWIVWTATLADDRQDFAALVAPVYHWADATRSRVPLTDWYDTVSGKQQGFQARSVVGGVYMPMLTDGELWKKWAGRAAAK